jgi:hypothetical protein
MSDTIEKTDDSPNFEVAGEDDVRRTLAELQRKNIDLEKEVAAERNRRVSLETNLEGERVARTTAETERDSHAARVVTEAESRWNAEKAATTTAISMKEKALETAEESYARHAELGEWKEAAKAQSAMAREAAELHTLRQKVEYLESNKERMVPKPSPRTEQRQAAPVHTHRYAQFINGDLVGDEERWLDERPQFSRDPSYRQQVFSASAIAAARHARGTEPYFREIERILGEDQNDRQDTRQDNRRDRQDYDDRANQRQQRQSADLPASRRAAPGADPSEGQRTIRLTADEREIADSMFGDPNQETFYIADQGKRYEHYHTMKMRKAGR